MPQRVNVRSQPCNAKMFFVLVTMTFFGTVELKQRQAPVASQKMLKDQGDRGKIFLVGGTRPQVFLIALPIRKKCPARPPIGFQWSPCVFKDRTYVVHPGSEAAAAKFATARCAELTWGRQVRENPLHLTPMIIFNKKVISKEQPQRPAIPNKSFSPPEQSSVVAMAM